jgi:hypothetical protein
VPTAMLQSWSVPCVSGFGIGQRPIDRAHDKSIG